MGLALRRIAHRVFNGHSNLNIRNANDLLVIEAPYFSKAIDGRDDQSRLAFVSASREDGNAPWCVRTQSYTRTYYKDGSVSDSGFDHGENRYYANDADMVGALTDFQLDKIIDGYEQHERKSSTYSYGLPLTQAMRYLDLASKPEAPSPR